MEAPERIEPWGLSDYLEVMSKSVFQAGISWRVVDQKWPGIREALREFDTDAVANLNPEKLDQLTNDVRMIRNRRTIEAIVANAQRMLDLEQRHGAFRNYLRSRHRVGGAQKATPGL